MIRIIALLALLIANSSFAQDTTSFWKKYCLKGVEYCFPVLVVQNKLRTVMIPEPYMAEFGLEKIAEFRRAAMGDQLIVKSYNPDEISRFSFAATETIDPDELSVFDTLVDIPDEAASFAGSFSACIGASWACAASGPLIPVTLGVSTFITWGVCSAAGVSCVVAARDWAKYVRYREKQKQKEKEGMQGQRHGSVGSDAGRPSGDVPSGATMGRPANTSSGSVHTSIGGRAIGSSGQAGGGGQIPNVNEDK